MDFLIPIRSIFEDVNFELIDSLRIKILSNLKSYKYYGNIFTSNKTAILYFEDFIVYMNESVLIRKYLMRKEVFYEIDFSKYYYVDNMKYLCDIVNIAEDLQILNSLNKINSIAVLIIKIITILNNIDSINLNLSGLFDIPNDIKFSNEEIKDMIKFFGKYTGVLTNNLVNSNNFVTLDLINKFIDDYNIEDCYKLILKNCKINYLNPKYSKDLQICNLANDLLTIFDLSKDVNNYLENNKNEIDKIKDSNETSKMLYHSIITQTNWVDEIEYGNFMGLLINVCPKDINCYGYNFDFIPINSITNTVISFEQFLEAYDLSDKYDKWSNVLSGNGVGDGNNILPLYINVHHWNIVKYYYKFYLGMTFNRNCLDYMNKYSNIYKNVLIKMINMTYCNDNYSSDKWLNLLFSVSRTYYEIFGNEVIMLEKFKNDMIFRTECNINDILLQYIFSDNTNEGIIKYIFEEVIRRTLKSLYKDISKLDSLYYFNEENALNYESIPNDWLCDVNFNEWVKELQKNLIFSEKLTLIHGVTMLNKIFHKCKFDNYCGILDDESLNFLKIHVKKHKMNPENDELIGIMSKSFKSHINFTKDKIFTINCLKDLNIIKDSNEVKSLLIQCLVQRVNKSRKNAILNNKIEDPFNKNNIIKRTGLLISQRYLKIFYNLNNSKDYTDYISLINKSIDNEKFKSICNVLISKTISVKKYVLENISYIDSDIRQEVLKCLT